MTSRVVTAMAAVLALPAPWFVAPILASRGLPPATAVARDAYLRAELPSYAMWQAVNAEIAPGETVVNLYDASMAYFARGRFAGDWFGPTRYARIESVLASSRDLFALLREQLGARFFVVRRDALGSRSLPMDAYFLAHFHVLNASSRAIAFRLRDEPMPPVTAGSLVANGGFEEGAGLLRRNWVRQGRPLVDGTGAAARYGTTAVRTTGSHDSLWQEVPVVPDAVHVLAVSVRPGKGNGEMTATISWLDEERRPLRCDEETVVGARSWVRHEVLLTPPPGAWRVRIALGSPWSDEVWWDDVEFNVLAYH